MIIIYFDMAISCHGAFGFGQARNVIIHFASGVFQTLLPLRYIRRMVLRNKCFCLAEESEVVNETISYTS